MAKANEVAMELRILAASLDKLNGAEVKRPFVFFSFNYCGESAKDEFLALAHVLPHPLIKEYSETELMLKRNTGAMSLQLCIERSKVCILVEPARAAVYRCESILSDDEEAAIDTGRADEKHAMAEIEAGDIRRADADLLADSEV